MGSIVRTEKCRVCDGLKYRLVIHAVDEMAFQPHNDPPPEPWYAWVECDPCNGEGFVQVYEYVDNVTVATPEPYTPPGSPTPRFYPTYPPTIIPRQPWTGDPPPWHGGTICKSDDATS